MKLTRSFAYFNGADEVFSTWYPAQFYYQAIPFENVQHFVNYSKAMLFKSHELAERIYKAKDPKLCQELGQKIEHFNQEKWNAHREKYVHIACREKFLQHNDLLTLLFETGDRMLVEATPHDFYWGIGLSEDDPRANTPSQWPGRNRLGHILTEFREWMMEGYDEGTLPRRASWAIEEMIQNAGARKAG